METTQSVRTAKSVVNRIRKGTIRFDSYFQRQTNQWSKLQKALLIDSAIRGIPIPGVYLEKQVDADGNATCYIIDGCQRLSTIAEFMDGDFKLPRSLPDVDGMKLAGCGYKTLPETLKSALDDCSIILCIIEAATDEEVVELFRRLNNGKPLTAAQQNKAVMGERLARMVADLAGKPVFEKILSPTQLKRDEAQMIVVQSLMLLAGEVSNMRNKQIQAFIEEYAQSINEEDLQLLSELLDSLDTILPEGRNLNLKKLSVPAILKALSEFYRDEGRIEAFRENLLLFLGNPSAYPDYVRHVSVHTSDKEHIYGRVEFFESLTA